MAEKHLSDSVYDGSGQITSTGSADAYVIGIAQQLNGYYQGMPQIRFKANFTNSGAATANIVTQNAPAGLGAVTLKKEAGATDLASGDIVSGGVYTLAHDGTNFQVLELNSVIPPASEDGVSAGLHWNFDSATAMADPGTGDFRLNDATLSSVTAAAVSDLTAETGNPDASAWVLAFDDSTNTVRGTLVIKKQGEEQNFAIYNVTGASTDNSGWTQLALTYVAHNGSFSDTDSCVINFNRAGNAGAAGTPGSGGVITVNIQTFTASGTYTPTSGMLYCIVEVQAPGGGGGGADVGTNANRSAGGGGEAGEYAKGVFSAATIGVSQAVTIGSVGASGSNAGGNGGNAGDVSVGALITANGGNGGTGSGSTNNDAKAVAGGSGGGTGGTGGSYRVPGGGGHNGLCGGPTAAGTTANAWIAASGGNGGNGVLGLGGRGGAENQAGQTGGNYGGGGGGAATTATSGQIGGAGGPGIVVITEYIA